MTRPPLFFPIRAQLGLALIAVLGLATCFVFVMLSRFEHRKLIDAKREAGTMVTQLFQRSVTVTVEFDDETGVRDAVALLARDPEVVGVEVWRLAHDAAVKSLASSGSRLAYHRVEHLEIDEQRTLLILRDAIRDPDGAVIGAVTVQLSLDRENRAYAELRRRILLAAAAVALAVSLLLWWTTRRSLLLPLDRLLRAVVGLERGESVSFASGSVQDEVGRLALAFTRMADVVAKRESDIATRNRDMRRVLDNVGQGFLVLGLDGSLAPERSAILDEWFGVPLDDDVAATYFARIDPVMAGMLEVGLEALRDGFMPLEVSLAQLPDAFASGGSFYRCAYHPVLVEDVLQQLVVVVSDVTSSVEREHADRAQHDFIAAVSRVLADRGGFQAFLLEADALVQRIVLSESTNATFFRDLHTLKGAAGIYGLENIAATCHALEDELKERVGQPAPSSFDKLVACWRQLRNQLARFVEPTADALELTAADLDQLERAICEHAPHARLLQIAKSWRDSPIRGRLERLGEHAKQLASRLGKCEVEVLVQDEGVRLPREPWSGLWQGLVHVVRNAVDHGLEQQLERLATAKSPTATVRLRSAVEDSMLVVTIADDGRGIDWDKLRAKAVARGLRVDSHAELVELLFMDGISTSDVVSDISGRGVGLAAVRHLVAALGGTIEVTSGHGAGTEFRFQFPLTPERPIAAELDSPRAVRAWTGAFATARPNQRHSTTNERHPAS